MNQKFCMNSKLRTKSGEDAAEDTAQGYGFTGRIRRGIALVTRNEKRYRVFTFLSTCTHLGPTDVIFAEGSKTYFSNVQRKEDGILGQQFRNGPSCFFGSIKDIDYLPG